MPATTTRTSPGRGPPRTACTTVPIRPMSVCPRTGCLALAVDPNGGGPAACTAHQDCAPIALVRSARWAGGPGASGRDERFAEGRGGEDDAAPLTDRLGELGQQARPAWPGLWRVVLMRGAPGQGRELQQLHQQGA